MKRFDHRRSKHSGGPELEKSINFKKKRRLKEYKMLWTIAVILFVLWLLGFLTQIGGDLIHVLLVIALIVIVYNFVQGRGRA
jgi:fatty acid desaturase